MKQINDDIDDANRYTRQLQDTKNSLKTSAYEYTFEAEKKSTITEIKTVISKSNARKRAATEKQNLLDTSVKKRCLFIEKKDKL